MKISINTMNVSAKGTVRLAQVAERCGFHGFSMVDTAPLLYQAMYPTVTACLLATDRIRIGPHVTNPVSQHWSVHAASARTMEEMAPGRFFLGMATGDGALHSVGLRPFRIREFEAALQSVKSHLPEDIPLQVAASGPRAIECAGRVADELIVGVGLNLGSIEYLVDRALSARRAAGVEADLPVWATVPFWSVVHADELPPIRKIARANAFSLARLNLSPEASYEGKNIPTGWEEMLRERFGTYDFSRHAVAGDQNPNNNLFSDRPDVEEYLLDRFSLTGTVETCAARMDELAAAGIDGLVLNLLSVGGADLEDQLQLAARVAAKHLLI